jgi:hypothetical protein
MPMGSAHRSSIDQMYEWVKLIMSPFLAAEVLVVARVTLGPRA